MKITIESINKEFREYISFPCYGKGKFGLYSVTLKNGRVIAVSTLKDLKESIEKEIRK